MFARPQISGLAPRPPSQVPFFALIAKQNESTLFPYLIKTNGRVEASLTASTLYRRTGRLSSLSHSLSGSEVAFASTTVDVVRGDSFDYAAQLMSEGKQDIAVLNMANSRYPGGMYLEGEGGQEEALCRRSTLYRSIGPQRNFHPIPNHGAIYSPEVMVVRKSDEDGCELLTPDERWWTSVISVSAIARPSLNAARDDFARKADRLDTRERIRTLLRVAALEGRRNLVLSALGCGAFENPPRAVAELFRHVLCESEFIGRFQGIWFAIFDRAQGSCNYDIFKEVLGEMEF